VLRQRYGIGSSVKENAFAARRLSLKNLTVRRSGRLRVTERGVPA